MDNKEKPKILLLFLHHSQTHDSSGDQEMSSALPECDPALTKEGKKLAREAGERAADFISKYNGGAYS